MSFDELRTEILDKINSKLLTGTDVPAYMHLLCETGNSHEKIQLLVTGWNRLILFDIEDLDNFWMKIQDGYFTSGNGDKPGAGIKISLTLETAISLFTGEISPGKAFMSGVLRFSGNYQDIHQLQKVIRELGSAIKPE